MSPFPYTTLLVFPFIDTAIVYYLIKYINLSSLTLPLSFAESARATHTTSIKLLYPNSLPETESVQVLFGFIIIPFGTYFNLEETSVEIQVASSSKFLGIIIGSTVASLLTKKIGRVITINCSNFIFFISFLIKNIWLNIPLFIICEVISGIALGIIIPIFLNIYGE